MPRTGKAGEVRGQGRLQLDPLKATNHPAGSSIGKKCGWKTLKGTTGSNSEEEGTRVCRDTGRVKSHRAFYSEGL